MKHILLCIMMAIFSWNAMAQNESLVFTGTDLNGNFVNLQQVVVSNVSQGWQEILNYPDTVLTLNNIQGVEESTILLSQNYPNPFHGTTSFSISMPQDGNVSLRVFDLMGRQMLHAEHHMSPGLHQFNLFLSKPQTYLLQVVTTFGSTSIKLINYGEGEDDAILYVGAASMTSTRGPRLETTRPFDPGDLMAYTGYAEVNGRELTSATASCYLTGSAQVSLSFDMSQDWPTGALCKRFSVGPIDEIYISSGNLQYHAVQDLWRLAPLQYDWRGTDNANIDANYDGWIDLFGWGTSGYDGKTPYMHNTDALTYGNGEGNIATTQYDWGVHNAISNGGNQVGQWRTMMVHEWDYLLNGRADADQKRAAATIEGTHGLILLPDEWVLPENSHFTPGHNGYDANVYTLEEWFYMEQAGAAFFPSAALRYGTDIYQLNKFGYYWTANADGAYDAKCVTFGGTSFNSSDYYFRYGGLAVRLVQDY